LGDAELGLGHFDAAIEELTRRTAAVVVTPPLP
jgi:hypothetical protein